MAQSQELPGLDALQAAMASGDMSAIRDALLRLTEDERSVLETRLGTEAVERLYQKGRKARRGPGAGRVIVIHGIMGARLATDGTSDSDRIWLNYLRLARGRIRELALALDGGPAKPTYKVRVDGMFPEYLPMLTELGEQWQVRPFAFDWRSDLDRAADELAQLISGWSKGEPTHIVAHSMGGLVARRFIQLHADVWKSMEDPSGQGRGGRLIMLGTPNRGSFAIPLVLTGREKTVRMLEMLDLKHDMSELLGILSTFLGCYQMLPAPGINGGDDRVRLFDRETWGALPVHDQLLKRGRDFQETLFPVIDPQRLIYVAGYNQRTPHRIKVDKPGVFLYQETLDGDGRVPHDLGLLDDVRNFWVNESHGSLPRNVDVLAGIHELLRTGATNALEQARPTRRGGADAPDKWQRAEEVEPIPQEVVDFVAKPVRRGKTSTPAATREEIETVEAEILRDYLGGAREAPTRAAVASPAVLGKSSRAERDGVAREDLPRLTVEVVWGSITDAEGDVYVSGHYERVLPQNAELALDRVVSAPGARDDDLVLTSLTRRGILRGALGDVEFYPWAREPGRLVAIAGMGRPGSFQRMELRRLARSLTWAISSLPNVQTVCTVLIGSGVGNLSVAAAVEGLILGMVDALGLASHATRVHTLRIVERSYRKAIETNNALQALAEREAIADRIMLETQKDIVRGTGGVVGATDCLALTLASTLQAMQAPASSRTRKAVNALLGGIPSDGNFRQEASEALRTFAGRDWAKERGRRGALDIAKVALRFQVSEVLDESDTRDGEQQPTRVSLLREGDEICVAALTDTAVIPERRNRVDFKLVEEAIGKMTDPKAGDVPDLARLISRLLIPRDFRELLTGNRPVVFEVDRHLAKVHWEMIARNVEDDVASDALSRSCAVARQLRTGYSPPPSVERHSSGPLRALVIGDPGDPRQEDDLPGARREALEVAELLRAYGVDVSVMIGAPSAPRSGELRGIPAAARLDVLRELLQGGYDLLHYCGHGDFDPEQPDAAGWVFEGGLLTSRELERIDLAPRLIVANACLSGLASQRLRSNQDVVGRGDADLLPGLADEFFRRGVRNYIGTAWEVSDVGAVMFAKTLYTRLFEQRGDGRGGATFGAAVQAAREQLFAYEKNFGALWGAYQHYGDPTQRLVAAPVQGRPPADGGTRGGAGPSRAGRSPATRSKGRTARKKGARGR